MDDLSVETNKLMLALAKSRFAGKISQLDRVGSYVSKEVISAKRLAANEAFQKAVKDLL